jgi:hypothetical protein
MVLKRSQIASSSSSGTASNDFTITTGTDGNTRVDLSSTFPVGNYIVTSTLGDTSYDIYLIAEDGTNAGYVSASTASTSITATKAFNKVVLYGATNNDTISFQFKYVFSANAASTNEFGGAAARVISINTSSLPNQDNTTTITGQNFATDVAVTFTGSDNVARSTKSIVRASSTQLIVTRPDDLPPQYSPYTITVSNPGLSNPTSSNAHKLNNSVTAGASPVWVTASTLPSYRKDDSFSTSISATDADGGSSVTYSIVSGTLPSGLTFNPSTATFSGTPTTNAASPYSYTIRATDSGGNYVDRSFTVQQLAPDSVTVGTATDIGTNRSYNNGAATVSFTPAVTGPAATSYTVEAYLNGSATGITGTGSSSPVTITGLASNTNYTFLVRANNAAGNSLNSSQTSQALITTVPQAPTIGSVSNPGLGSSNASVPFTANASGGKTITSYQIVTNPGSLTFSSGSTPVGATGLAFGTNYTFQVRALNANGYSDYSSSSNQISVAYPTTLSDNFNRSGAIGTASDGINVWSNVRGTWTTNGSQASNSDSAGNNNIAAVTLSSNGISNLQADLPSNNGGLGLSFWVTDANSYWAAYMDYYTDTTTVCETWAWNYSSTCPGGCCSSCSSGNIRNLICQGDNWGGYWAPGCGVPGPVSDFGCPSGYWDSCQPYSQCQTSSNTTRYNSRINISNNGSTQTSSLYNQSTSGYSQARSIAVSTSGNTITARAYSDANKGGTNIGTASVTPGSPTKGNRVGLFRGSSSTLQGSVIDNISATVV